LRELGQGRTTWAALALALISGWGCHGSRAASGPVAQIETDVSITPATVPEGQAIAVTYRWRTGPGFQPLSGDYLAFVHALDTEGAMVFTDDHAPTPMTSAWRPSQEYSYTHILFAPQYMCGRLTLRVGLYKDGERLTMRGKEVGRQEYAVGDLTIVARREPPVRFGADWSRPESYLADAFRPARWLQQPNGTIWIENPRKDALALLSVRAASAYVGTWPALRVVVGNAGWTLPIQTRDAVLLRLRVPKVAWGRADWCPVEIALLREAADRQSFVTEEGRTLVLDGIAVRPIEDAAPALAAGAQDPSDRPFAQ